MKNIFGSIKTASDGFAVLAFAAGCAFIAADLVAGCAGWGQETCKVIDLAQAACPPVVQYLGEDGKPKQMQLTHEGARAADKAQKTAAARDAGADGAK